MSTCAAPAGSPCRTGKGKVAIQYHFGYARASTARQSLDAQLDSLTEAQVTRTFSEKISTRTTRRPHWRPPSNSPGRSALHRGNGRAPTIPRAACSPCWPPYPAWNASTSAAVTGEWAAGVPLGQIWESGAGSPPCRPPLTHRQVARSGVAAGSCQCRAGRVRRQGRAANAARTGADFAAASATSASGSLPQVIPPPAHTWS